MNEKDKKILELLERVKSYIGTGLLRRNPFSAEEEVLLNDLERDIDSAVSELKARCDRGRNGHEH